MSLLIDNKISTVFKLVVLTGMMFYQTCLSAAEELVILTWSDYMDPALVEKFKKTRDVNVRFIYFEDDDSRDKMLINSNGSGFDLVLINGAALDIYQKRGWLAPVDKKQIANLKHINNRWLKPLADGQQYAVPYFWGTLGIAYRKDLVPEPVTSWKQLFQPAEILRGKIVMMATNRDVIGMALKSQGFSVNSDSKAEYEQVRELLWAQKPFVNKYAYIAMSEQSALVTGEVSMAMAFNGDALMLKEFNNNIEFVVPEEGSNLWIDYFAVLKTAKHKTIAYDFLNFINEPEHAAQQAGFVYYATPNSQAEKLMPYDYLTDPVIYPPQQILEKSEYYLELPAKIVKQRNQIMSELLR